MSLLGTVTQGNGASVWRRGQSLAETLTKQSQGSELCVWASVLRKNFPLDAAVSPSLSLSQFGVIEETQRCKKEIDEEICKKEKTNKTLGIQKAIVCPAEYIHFVSFKCPSDEIK